MGDANLLPSDELTATAPSSFDDVTDDQVESFRRDGFLTIEESFFPVL